MLDRTLATPAMPVTVEPVEAAELDEAVEPPVRRRAPKRLTRLDRRDWGAIGVVLGAHVALAVITYCSAWIEGSNGSHLPLTRGYQQWDANLYVNYAQHGLFSAASTPNNAAFLPGFPLLLAAVHLILRNWIDAALLISLVADCFTAVLLNRMAGSTRAALFLCAAPRPPSWVSATASRCSWPSPWVRGTSPNAGTGRTPQCWRLWPASPGSTGSP